MKSAIFIRRCILSYIEAKADIFVLIFLMHPGFYKVPFLFYFIHYANCLMDIRLFTKLS